MNRFDKRLWGIILVGISVVLIISWAYFLPEEDFSTFENVVFQAILTALGCGGSFALGQFDSEQRLRVQAKERYRRLRTLLLSMIDVSSNLADIEAKPRLSREQEIQGKLTDYSRAFSYVGGQIDLWVRNLGDCLEFWNDYAPKQVEEMHEELFGRREERDNE